MKIFYCTRETFSFKMCISSVIHSQYIVKIGERSKRAVLSATWRLQIVDLTAEPSIRCNQSTIHAKVPSMLSLNRAHR